MPKKATSKGNATKKKNKKTPRARSFMYAEAIGCLPKHFLDRRYVYTGEEWDTEHADGTKVIYYKDAVIDMNAIEDYLEEHLPENTQFAIMVHDREYKQYLKDMEDDTEIPKAVLPHLHIAMYFENARTPSAVRKDLGLYDKTKDQFIEIFKDKTKVRNNNQIKKSLFSYLPHWTAAAKADKIDYGDYLTNRDKCRANFNLKKYVEDIRIDVLANDLDLDEIKDAILNGDLIEYDFHKIENATDRDKALRKFYSKNKTTLDNDFKIRSRMLTTVKSSDDLTILYFSGHSGSGKTITAIQFAEKNFRSVYVSGGENDFLQNYMGQECIIIDDARPTMLSASDWLKMIDPSGYNASVKSRYYNKTLNVKCIIFTTIMPFEEFFVYAKNRGSIKEPVQQFIRRVAAVVDVASSDKLREVLQGRQTGTRLYAKDKDNFRIAREDRAIKYTENYTKNHDIETDIENFKRDYEIDEILKEYDNYAIGRVYTVEKIDGMTKIKIPDTDTDEPTTYEVNRKLVEHERLMIGKLKNENNVDKINQFKF